MLPVSFMCWSSLTVTDWWRPRVIRGCDEWHNLSWGVNVPPFGVLLVFRMRWPRVEGGEHIWAAARDHGFEGVHQPGCAVCQAHLDEAAEHWAE